MGVTFHVQHFVHPLPHTRFGPRSSARINWYAHRWGLLARICKTFNWHGIPWNEPGEEDDEAIADFINCSVWRYTELRGFTKEIDRRRLLSTSDLAQHFADRQDSGYTAIYLPVMFSSLIRIENDPEWETITIGSSVAMRQVLEDLAPHCHEHIQSAATPEAKEKAELMDELRQQILGKAEQSVAQNLPLFISW